MTNESSNRHERGIALLVALFTLVLLSVIGLGMMYSTNMETAINSNYRDKQLSIYAARAGLQEARDRIQPATHNITAPTALPDLAAANIIYIINPRGGETVAPWDLSNRYADTDLCHENVLSLTSNAGPCTTIASGSSWYSVVNDSLVASAPWNLTTPMDTKWTRISLKTNNMTSVAANGDTSNYSQACWDGSKQVIRPAGYGTDCAPNGSVVSITVTAPGTGYTSVGPTVTMTAPPSGGVQATATPVMTAITTGQVNSVTVTNPGSGYTSAPTVTFTGDGTGAAATATIIPAGAPVASVSLSSVGTQCYSAAPTVAISGGGGSGATATATLDTTKSCVASWSVSNSCTARKGTTATGVTLSGASGSGFSGSIVFSNGTGNVSSVSIQDPGTGYTSNPTTLSFASGGACPSLTLTAFAGYHISSINLTSGGAGYTSVPTVSIASGSGTTATTPTGSATLGAAVANAGQISAITVTNPGNGYSTAPTVTLSGGAGTGGTATAALGTTYTVTGMTITNAGRGYLFDPTVTFSGGSGSGAAATARLGHGTNYGKIYLITSLAETSSGARSMAQMELATPVMGFNVGGALTLDGPNPAMINMPSSTQFWINGNDSNSCSETADEVRPAIGGYDDPNADPPTHSMDNITSSLPRPDHYVGSGGTPSVQNVYGALGETMTTTDGLLSLTDAVKAAAAAQGHVYPNNPSSIELANSPINLFNVVYVDGDLTLNGNATGYGVLVVTGTLHLGGDFSWRGTVLVIGDGYIDFNGGGSGTLQGTVFVAKIWDSYTTKNLLQSPGTPTTSWVGGGNNGIYYDHCLAMNLIQHIAFSPPVSTRPLKVLSFRMIP